MTLVRPATHLDEVAALWESLVRHHYEVNPAIGRQAPPVGPEASWAGRRRQYEAWSAEPGWILVVADCDGAIRGYAAARLTESISAWDFGARIGRLESLAVEPGARGHGLGTALTDAVRAHWQGLGVRFATVSVIAGNDAAQRFYARLGAVEFTRTSIFGV